jgi:hypothetical protein
MRERDFRSAIFIQGTAKQEVFFREFAQCEARGASVGSPDPARPKHIKGNASHSFRLLRSSLSLSLSALVGLQCCCLDICLFSKQLDGCANCCRPCCVQREREREGNRERKGKGEKARRGGICGCFMSKSTCFCTGRQSSLILCAFSIQYGAVFMEPSTTTEKGLYFHNRICNADRGSEM